MDTCKHTACRIQAHHTWQKGQQQQGGHHYKKNVGKAASHESSSKGADLQACEMHDTAGSADLGPGHSNGLRYIEKSHGCLDALGVDVQSPACDCVSEALGVWEVLCLKALVPFVQGVVALFADRLVPLPQSSTNQVKHTAAETV